MTEPTDAEIKDLYAQETGFILDESPAALLDFARWQEQHHQGPETPEQIAEYLRDLSRRMLACGTAMDYYGGFGGNMAARGLEMIGAARMAHDWAAEIEAAMQKEALSDA